MFVHGRPRYWIDWYDRWHWLLGVLLLGLLVAAWKYPAQTLELRRGLSRSPVLQPLPPPAMVRTTIESPQNGQGFFQSRLSDVEGRAQPGSVVNLEYAVPNGVWTELGRMLVDPAGHYRFALRNFPAGSYRLRTQAVAPNGHSERSEEIMFTVVADAPASRTKSRRH